MDIPCASSAQSCSGQGENCHHYREKLHPRKLAYDEKLRLAYHCFSVEYSGSA